MSSPLPAVACGGVDPQVFNAIMPLYQPEYEIIHTITSSTEGATQLPFLLQGQTPPASEIPNRGTGNYSKPPVAIFAGAAYGDAEIEEMREACKGHSSVPWLRMDLSLPRPPLGPQYAPHVLERIKACMRKIEAEGKLNEDGVWFY